MNRHQPRRASAGRLRTRAGRRTSRLSGMGSELLESRDLLAAVAFAPQQVVDDLDADGANHVVAADIDGDGDLDAVVTSYRDDRVSWFENRGAGEYVRRPIPGTAPQARDVVVADFDGDLDLDLAVAAYYADSIQWYENTDGAGQFTAPRLISIETNGVRSLAAADLDLDGDVDLAAGSWFDNKLSWYANDGQGNFSNQLIVSTDFNGPRSIQAADVDGDGRADLVVAARVGDSLSWFRNQPAGGFGSKQTIPFAGNGPEEITLGDVDHDGDLDLFVAVYWEGKIVWLENLDGAGNFGNQQEVSASGIRGQSVALGDLDGDGDLDVVSASYYGLDNRVAWHPNTDGQGSFGAERVVSRESAGAEHVTLADMDGDGAMDLLVASLLDNKVTWYRNRDGQATFDPPQQILSDAGGAAAADLADLDGDGDLDLLSASYWDNEIAWYENLDGLGQFSRERVITRSAARAQTVRAADLDGDGDTDVLSASYADGKIAWYENLDGRATFGPQQLLTNRLNGPVHVHAADLDADGDLDVISASAADGIIGWFENTGGPARFGELQILTRRAVGAEWVTTADLDHDGDLDILSASYVDGKLNWFSNLGEGQFGAATTIATGGGPTTVEALDLDGDGDLDLVSTRYDSNNLVWFENLGGATWGPAQVIAADLRRVEALSLADIDDNGTLDLVVGGDLFLVWYERLGDGTFVGHFISGNLVQGFGVATGDVNGDGRLDVVSASFGDSKLALYRNASVPGDFDTDGAVDAADIELLCQAIRAGSADAVFDLDDNQQVNALDMDHLVEVILQTSYGDANLDGLFSSRDLVAIFQAGQYEDLVAGNSTWSEGDWDCDGDFTTRDLVVAFQRGVYSLAASPGNLSDIAAALLHSTSRSHGQRPT